MGNTLRNMKTIIQHSEKLSWNSRIGYASGDYSLNLFWQGTSFFLMVFYMQVLGLPPSIAGFVVMVGNIWDAFTDPLMGFFAERTRSKWGAYRPYLVLGALPLALSFALLFWVPASLEGNWLYGFVLVTLLFFKTCYTVVSIPYSTLGARMSSDTHERTRLMGVRMMAGFLGGMTVTGLAWLFRSSMADKQAFFWLGITCAVISVAVLYFCFKQTAVAARRPNNAPRARNIFEALQTLLRNRAFVLILLSVACVAVANVFINATVLFYFQDALGDRAAGNTALFIMTSTPLIAIPFWSAVALKFDKKPSWVLGSGVIILGAALLYFDRSGSITRAYGTYITLSFGLSAYAVLFWSMLPDTIEYGEHATGIRNESTIIGVVSAGQKISLALSAMALGLMLEKIGYIVDTSRSAIIQSPETIDGLRTMIASVSATALVVSALFILLYPINSARHREILAELDTRHK